MVRVESEDKERRDFGLGYFNPKSLIAVRLLETTGEANRVHSLWNG